MYVFAHRGASGYYPENTLLAIQTAIDMGVDGVEIDVQSCRDNFVIFHDSKFDRIGSLQGSVRDKNFREIQAIELPSQQRIPSLDEVLNCIKPSTKLNLELKQIDNTDALLNTLDEHIALGHISFEKLLISSYDHPLLYTLKKIQPSLNIGALTASIPLDYALFAQRLSAFSVHVDKEFINLAFVKDAHQRGLKVFVYTVDTPDELFFLKTLGVDGVFSNFPDRIQAALIQSN